MSDDTLRKIALNMKKKALAIAAMPTEGVPTVQLITRGTQMMCLATVADEILEALKESTP